MVNIDCLENVSAIPFTCEYVRNFFGMFISLWEIQCIKHNLWPTQENKLEQLRAQVQVFLKILFTLCFSIPFSSLHFIALEH